ncbi:MAG: hypothetical protein RMJ48_20265 [Roseiflexaceae bacterium]|nr:hypothetical protein [Roseiflexaceae bacterium]
MLRMINFFLICLLLASVHVALPSRLARAQPVIQSVNPVLVGTSDLPRSNYTKFGELAASWTTNTVHAIAVNGDRPRKDTFYWRKPDSSVSFPEPVDLGDSSGQTDYTGADVATAWHNQNVVVVVWLDRDGNRIFFRRSDDGGQTWGSPRVVYQGGDFPVTPKVGIRSFADGSLGEVVITWRDPELFYFTICNAQGEGCIGRQYLDGSNREKAYGQAAIAVGPNGALGIAYVTSATVYARIWDSTKAGAAALATRETVAAQNSLDRYFDTTMAIAPSGAIFVAYRRLDRKLETGGADQGDVFFAERKGPNNWPRSRINNVQSRGTVAVAADQTGSLHFFWVRAREGASEYFYTKRLPDGSFTNNYIGSSPVFIANGMATATVSDWAYGHGALEAFVPGGQIMRYYLFRTPGDNCVAQTITIGNGNTLPGISLPVVRDPTVVGTIVPSTTCTPAEQRVVLNAQDANAPATPWSGVYNVPIANLEQCRQTINVQLRANNRSQFDPQWRGATFIADPSAAGTPVDAAVEVMNPKMLGVIPPTFSPITPAGDLFSEGASGGDPGYTRIPQMHLRIADIGDCTGLTAYNVLYDANALFQSGLMSGWFSSNLPLPPLQPGAPLAPGETRFRIQVFDRAGNSFTLPRRMVYDPPGDNGEGRPVMDLSRTVLGADTNTLTILRTLIITDIVVTDNLYRRGESVPERGYVNTQTPPNSSDQTKQFWGLWIAVEYLGKEPDAATRYPPLPHGGLTFDNLRWQAVEVPNAVAGARVRFNLFDGVLDRTASSPRNGFGPDLTKDGTYRVYVKALDGAGNASQETYGAGGSLTTANSLIVKLDPGYEVVTICMPIIGR